MPPPVGIKEKTRSVKRHLKALEKKHKPAYPPESQPVLEKAIFGLLNHEAPFTNATRALRLFKDEFVDFNDLRVSSIREIATVMEDCRIDSELSYTLKDMLGQIFTIGHTLSLEFILEEELEVVEKHLGKLKAMPNWLATYVLTVTGRKTVVPLDPHTSRICQRLGLFGRKATMQTRRSTLKSIVSEADVMRFHLLFTEHGKKTCRDKKPRCDTCTLARDCDYRRKRKKSKGGR